MSECERGGVVHFGKNGPVHPNGGFEPEWLGSFEPLNQCLGCAQGCGTSPREYEPCGTVSQRKFTKDVVATFPAAGMQEASKERTGRCNWLSNCISRWGSSLLFVFPFFLSCWDALTTEAPTLRSKPSKCVEKSACKNLAKYLL